MTESSHTNMHWKNEVFMSLGDEQAPLLSKPPSKEPPDNSAAH